jgi:indolepyruvate ferredoxin oxidoreductase
VVRFRDADLASKRRLVAIESVLGKNNVATLNANALAETLFGDVVYANVIMLGHAWQQGLVPVSLPALARAIELNGVAVERNLQAVAAGRLACANPGFVTSHQESETQLPESLDDAIERRVAFLRDYQDSRWAERYRLVVERVRKAEGEHKSEAITGAVARSLFKLMSYKDEYEVARLHLSESFAAELEQQFEGSFKINYHLAPPLLPLGKDARGRPRKMQFGQWMRLPMRVLARLKGLRGTQLDLFGYTDERRTERALIGWYDDLIATILTRLSPDNLEQLLAIASAPMEIRGYGPVKEIAAKKVKVDVAAMLAKLDSVGRRAAA